MKKIFYIIVFFVTILFGKSILTNPKKEAFTKISNEIFDNIDMVGNLEIHNGSIEEKAEIAGDLFSINSNFGALIINNGTAKLEKSIVNGITNIKGNLISNGSTFYQPILVHGKSKIICSLCKSDSRFFGNTEITETDFNNNIYITDTDQVTIRGSRLEKNLILDSSSRSPKIKLENSKVYGNIVFTNKTGFLILSKSKIYGKVINGKIIKQ